MTLSTKLFRRDYSARRLQGRFATNTYQMINYHQASFKAVCTFFMSVRMSMMQWAYELHALTLFKKIMQYQNLQSFATRFLLWFAFFFYGKLRPFWERGTFQLLEHYSWHHCFRAKLCLDRLRIGWKREKFRDECYGNGWSCECKKCDWNNFAWTLCFSHDSDSKWPKIAE